MSTFKALGIPYPSSLAVDQHTASIGASGTLREWEARLLNSPDVTSSERSEALRVIESGLLTGRPGLPLPLPLPSASVEAFGELPAYSDISPPSSVTNEHELIQAIMRNLGPNGLSYVILVPSDELPLAAVERPSWDTGAGATDDEEVLSFATTPKKQKKVLRLNGFTWDRISQPSFQSNVLRDLQQALYHGISPCLSLYQGAGADKRCNTEYSIGKKESDHGALKPAVSVSTEEELVLKNISPMGLYETRSGRAVVIQVWK